MINLTIKYKYHLLAYNRYLNILNNGNTIGKIRKGETFEFQIDDSIALISFEDDYSFSNSIVLQDQHEYEIEVDTWLYGLKILFVVFYLLALTHRYYCRLKSSTPMKKL